jgi:DNA polymerase (family 10)
MSNRERALKIFAVASLLQARGANPYRVRAYQRAAVRLLRMEEDASVHLDERGELDLPGLGKRLRRKLGELVRTGQLTFHDELLAAEPCAIRTLMTVPGIGPRTADRLVGEAHVRGLKSLTRAARSGRLQRLRGVGPTRELAWREAAEALLAPASVAPEVAPVQMSLFDPVLQGRALTPAQPDEADAAPATREAGPNRAA